jgi:uncharacterized protein
MLESPQQKTFGQAKLNSLPHYCMICEVRAMCNGGCPKDRFILTPDGQPGLNYLCPGFKLFFAHCQPFVAEIAELWRKQNLEMKNPLVQSMVAYNNTEADKTGRNDRCPCGSGKKYKNCCMGKNIKSQAFL